MIPFYHIYCHKMWGISSAGRAPALHAGGQGFDPLILHHICGSGSGVEHRLAKARVASSNLVFRSNFYADVVQW